MPHIVLEFTDNLNLDVPVVLQQLHDALVTAGGTDVDRMKLKTRAISLSHSVVKDSAYNVGSMAHVTLSLLAGRSADVRKRYGQALYDVLCAHVTREGCALTLEVREMDRDTYFA